MNMNIKNVKITVTVPPENVDEVRDAVCKSGAGIIGNYTYCSISTEVVGTFKPNSDANPYVGEKEKLEFVNEKKLEFRCEFLKVKNVLKVIREVHPYEEPAIDIVPLIDEEFFN